VRARAVASLAPHPLPPGSPLRARAVGDAPVSYARWRVVPSAEIDGPAPAGASAAETAPIVVIDRLATLPAYRRRGFGKQTLADCLLDILEMMMSAGVGVKRIAMFIPRVPSCTFAAETASKCSLATASQRAYDPARAALPEFHGEAGVVEFAIAPAALHAMYVAARGGGAAGAAVPAPA